MLQVMNGQAIGAKHPRVAAVPDGLGDEARGGNAPVKIVG